jgi:hypothetical protein
MIGYFKLSLSLVGGKPLLLILLSSVSMWLISTGSEPKSLLESKSLLVPKLLGVAVFELKLFGVLVAAGATGVVDTVDAGVVLLAAFGVFSRTDAANLS